MINARTKYMAQLVAEAFNVQEYEASVSKTSKSHFRCIIDLTGMCFLGVDQPESPFAR